VILGSLRHVRVFVYREPVDMRKAYDTLAALVEGPMNKRLLSGDIFVFIGRRRKRAKALYFDGTGLCLLANNGTERAARGPVVGRKNHYGSRSLRGTEVAGLFYSLVESAKLNDLEPRFYLRVAVRAGLRHETVPLPHEVKAQLADGTLDPTEYDDATEGIVTAALAAVQDAARAGPSPPSPETEAAVPSTAPPPRA
jgi:hypothetical protein